MTLTVVFNSIIYCLDNENSVYQKHFCKLTCKVFDSQNTLALKLCCYVLSLKIYCIISETPLLPKGVLK